MMIAFVANTNNLELIGLRSAATELFINNATVSVTVKECGGEPVSGVSWPLAMDYVSESDGDYRCVISHTAEFQSGQTYLAEINVNAGAGNIGFWSFEFKALKRRD